MEPGCKPCHLRALRMGGVRTAAVAAWCGWPRVTVMGCLRTDLAPLGWPLAGPGIVARCGALAAAARSVASGAGGRRCWLRLGSAVGDSGKAWMEQHRRGPDCDTPPD